jgi:hypothetical protein
MSWVKYWDEFLHENVTTVKLKRGRYSGYTYQQQVSWFTVGKITKVFLLQTPISWIRTVRISTQDNKLDFYITSLILPLSHKRRHDHIHLPQSKFSLSSKNVDIYLQVSAMHCQQTMPSLKAESYENLSSKRGVTLLPTLGFWIYFCISQVTEIKASTNEIFQTGKEVKTNHLL